MVGNFTIWLRQPAVRLLPAITIFSVIWAFNILSIWYLARRSFRAFAARFVAEREKEKQSRAMQKRRFLMNFRDNKRAAESRKP